MKGARCSECGRMRIVARYRDPGDPPQVLDRWRFRRHVSKDLTGDCPGSLQPVPSGTPLVEVEGARR